MADQIKAAPSPSISTPKQRFQSQQQTFSNFRDLVMSELFMVAVNTALLEYNTQIASAAGDDGNGAAAMGLKLKGALEFIATLKGLAELPPTIKPRNNDGNLNYPTKPWLTPQ
jgi:hypothetical protein